ncbi:hypothetical protein JYT74_03345 [Crocinitomix catalasitica]|nr:hypothetical protein [Crocinitomix catalasitica]
MKILPFLVMGLLLITVQTTYGQKTNESFLKNYEAPDFRIRGLNFRFLGNSEGISTFPTNSHILRTDLGLGYFQLSNSKKYQGSIYTTFYSSLGLTRRNNEFGYNFQGYLSNSAQNRFYVKDKIFIGLHDASTLNKINEENWNASPLDTKRIYFSSKPAVSFGMGRLEPIHYARLALDIEKSLVKSDRLRSDLSPENRNELSNKIAEIRNKRFYDVRLGKIYQLTALDSVLQEMGLVTNVDMIYFAHLADNFLYAYQVGRMSGFRNEIGIAQGLQVSDATGDLKAQSTATYGYYSMNYALPISYSIQTDLNVSLIGGYQGADSGQEAAFPLWLDANYSFGLYPTTRTYLALKYSAGVTTSRGEWGYSTGLSLSAYYYLSPRVRISMEAGTYYGDDYNGHRFRHVAATNRYHNTRSLSYDLIFGFNYAIF